MYTQWLLTDHRSVAHRGGGVQFPPPPKFRRPSKIIPNLTWLWKLLKIAEFRMPTLQDVRIKGSKILKLLPVRNCFTLTMTNKLVVIISSLKVPKIKKIVLYEMKFLVPNYSCLQNPWLGGRGLPPSDPLSLSSVLNRICWTPPEQNSWVRHCDEEPSDQSLHHSTDNTTQRTFHPNTLRCSMFLLEEEPPFSFMNRRFRAVNTWIRLDIFHRRKSVIYARDEHQDIKFIFSEFCTSSRVGFLS